MLDKFIYEKRYSDNPETVRIWKYDVPLPIKPDKKDIINYGLPIEQQKFFRLPIPKDLKKWQKEARDEFVRQMYHIRDNGYWIYVKGKEIYLTGQNLYFLNFWHIEAGGLPEFRVVDVEDFLLWDYVRFNKQCVGYVKIKPRREGGSERALCIGYEEVTRGREYHFGMMANDDKRAGKNFKRLVKAHKKMIWFFQPIYRGSDSVQKELKFEEPEQRLSQKNFKEVTSREKSYETLGGYIDFMPSTVGQYDGDRQRFFFYDEIFKIFKYDPKEQWDIIRPTLQLSGGAKTVGKAQLLSTVEEYAQGKSIEYARKIWEDSDIESIGKTGQTTSGLLNYFRSAVVLAEIDAWGFPKTDEFIATYKKQEEEYIAKRDWRALSSWKRKFPMTVEDALQVPASESILHPALLERRISQIRERKNWQDVPDETAEPRAVRGNLVWENGIKYGKVKWQVTETGRWLISQHPINPNGGVVGSRPKNWKDYGCGLDPIDTKGTSHESTLSKVGITVFRKHNAFIDNEASGIRVTYDSQGNQEILNPEDMKTNRVVCTYRYRQDNPEDAYDDMVKTLFYYACQGMLENNRVYARNRFRELKLESWLANEPLFLRSNYKTMKGIQDKGVYSSVKTNEFSNEALIEYVYNYWMLIDHLDLLEDMRGFTGESDSRTKSDLTVSFGWALAAAMDSRYKPKEEEDFAFPDITLVA